MDSPELHVQDRLSTALHRVSVLERAIETQEFSKSGERLLSDLRRLSRDLERTIVETRDAATGRETLRRSADAASRRATLLFHLSPTPCMVIDRVGTIIDANPAAVQLVNTSLRHLAGRSLPMFVSADREHFLLRLTSLGKGDEPVRWPITLRPRERGCRKVVFTVVAEDNDNLLVLLLPPDDGTALADRVETSDAAPTQEPTGATFQGGSLPAS
jgi:PAS domain-containing protein